MFEASQGLLAASSYRLVYGLAAMLALLGVAMVILTIWLVRSTRPDPEVLARLEVLGTRRWRRASTFARRDLLDAVGATDVESSSDDDELGGDDDEIDGGDVRHEAHRSDSDPDEIGAVDGLNDVGEAGELGEADRIDGGGHEDRARDANDGCTEVAGSAELGTRGGDARSAGEHNGRVPDPDDVTPDKGLGRGSPGMRS